MTHWLLVWSDILSVVKWVMPAVGCGLLALSLKIPDDRGSIMFVYGLAIYILGVCLLAGVL